MWMCYSGGVGFGGYAGYDGYIRRLRLFEVDTEEARITTWKRVEFGDNAQARVDQQILVEAGKAYFAPPPQQQQQPPPGEGQGGEQQQQQ